MSQEPNPLSPASKPGRFKTFVAWVCGPIVLLELIGIAGVAVWAVQFSAKNNSSNPAYVSTARLLTGGTEVGTPIPDDFFATNIELIQSAAVLKNADLRVKALHPEMQPQPCKVEASRIPGTRIIVIRGAAADSKYAQAYVEAVTDELIAMRKEIRVEAMEHMVVVIQDELVRLEKKMQHEREEMSLFNKERDKLPEAERAKFDMVEDWKLITEKVERTKAVFGDLNMKLRKLDLEKSMDADVITRLEHACPGVLVKPTFPILNIFNQRSESTATASAHPARSDVAVLIPRRSAD